MTTIQQRLGFAASTSRTSHPARRTANGAVHHGWSPDQIRLAAMLAKAAGWDDDARKLVLRQLDGHALVGDDVTSTSPKLTNADFELYASVAERTMGGQITLKRKDGSIINQWRPHHFAGKVADHLSRMRRYAMEIAQQLEATGNLNPDGAGLRGWIRSRISGGETDDIERLDWAQLNALICSLKSVANRRGVRILDCPPPPAPGSESHG